jgi:nucleoid-associated protein YgaU
MGVFDFIRNIGKSILPGNEGPEIQENITKLLGAQVENLKVEYDDGLVRLSGLVESVATKQKAVLLAGNVKGVEKVSDDGLQVKPQPPAAPKEPDYIFYTIVSGDSLSKIAKKYYGDAMKWNTLFEANREVIQNADLIYPGQVIRVPKSAS